MLTLAFKRALLGVSLVAGSLSFTACSDYLDIEPINELPGPGNFDSPAKVDRFLTYAYDRLQSADMFGGQIQILSELYGDNLDFSAIQGTGGDADFRTRQFNIFGNPSSGTWPTAYRAIDNANLVINAVETNLFTADQAVKDRIKGEALFIRAVCHFELVRLYAKPFSNDPNNDPGIVIRTRLLSANETTIRVGRNRVGEVFATVISDLQQAAQLLPEQNGDRATKWAAKGYLARVYFEQNDFTNAAAQASDVIQNGGFTLGDPGEGITEPFRQSGSGARHPSVIFQLINLASDDASAGIRGAFYNYTGASVRLFLQQTGTVASNGDGNLVEALRQRGGLRYDSLVVVNEPGDPTTPAPQPYYSKYRGPDVFASTPLNIPVLRLQEMLLTRAESRAELGGNEAAIRADLNEVRRVANRPADNTTTGKQNLLDAVRYERRIELALEGDRFHQLRRLRQPSRGIAFNSGRLLPIPQSEVNGNAGIEQNGE